MSIEDLMQAMSGADQYQESGPAPCEEAQIEFLQDHHDRYVAPNPFKPGDLVRVRLGLNHKSEGSPAIVLEAADGRNPFGLPMTQEAMGSFKLGARANVRALQFMQGDYVSFFYDHAELEPYDGEGASS